MRTAAMPADSSLKQPTCAAKDSVVLPSFRKRKAFSHDTTTKQQHHRRLLNPDLRWHAYF